MLIGVITTFHICLLSQVLAQRDTPSENSTGGFPPDYKPKPPRCMTKHMTEVQNWVDDHGRITSNVDLSLSLDLSGTKRNVLSTLNFTLTHVRDPDTVKYLSLARCRLDKVPTVFHLENYKQNSLAQHVEYLTLYGNKFYDFSEAGEHYDAHINATGYREIDTIWFQDSKISAWAVGFQDFHFPKLKELDLRNCRIKNVGDRAFEGMPNLEALYLGENQIKVISELAFRGLKSLLHLDLSYNGVDDELTIEMNDCSEHLKNLISLDFSYTNLDKRTLQIFATMPKSLELLSLCFTGVTGISNERFFANARIKYLDVSGNNGILFHRKALEGLEKTLKVLYANEVGLRTVDLFTEFTALDALSLKNNELLTITDEFAEALQNLRFLDLSKNRISTWFSPLFRHLGKLEMLSLKNNNINVISEEMMDDIANITYIALSGNQLVCNCHSRELIEIAFKNELQDKAHELLLANTSEKDRGLKYIITYSDINAALLKRQNLSTYCLQNGINCHSGSQLRANGRFLLVDYTNETYNCIMAGEGITVHLARGSSTCPEVRSLYPQGFEKTQRQLLGLIAIPIILIVLLTVGYVFRWNIRYCYITMRNSTMLSLISKEDTGDEVSKYLYDVFVSYCNEDRDWVLDYLLPHLEEECNVSVCLHERDFQVGLSILENIVSCMDRSRSIVLVISKKFLLSQWCQFEMHLAQHRLLETRREDLILVLLEDIPRRARPTTLHYLMVTKTYIVWPRHPSEQSLFWRRLHNSLLQYRLKLHETNVSLA